MSRLPRTILFALMLTAASTALAAETDPLASLDESLKALAVYEFGKDSRAPSLLEDLVVAAAKDPKQRDAVEQRLIRALGAATTVDAKSLLCRQLRTIGTARCVPPLESLLTDPSLSHMARYALGAIADPAAEDALQRALGKTSGKLQAGIINTLADRCSAKAVPDLAKLLDSSDVIVADAAATALGRIGSAAAAQALQAARSRVATGLRRSIDDALLACADQFLAAGKKPDASRIYEAFFAPDSPKRLRLAALRGLVAARGADGVVMLVEAIRGADRQLQRSAIGFVPVAEGQEATKAFVDLLPALVPEAQELLVRALAERRDAAAAPAVAAAAKGPDEAVRVAAIEALGVLGDTSSVGLLAEVAATGRESEQQVARASLVRLRGDDVDAAVIKAIAAGEPKVRMEMIRALAGRGAVQGVDALLQVAKDDNAPVRREAIAALGALVREAELPALVDLAVNPKAADDRPFVENAVGYAYRRITDADKQAGPVLAALDKAPVEAKPALVRLLGRSATPKALAAVRAALKDPDGTVQDTAVRTLADWPEAAPAGDLLQLARESANKTHRVLALRGYIRIAGLSKNPMAMYLRSMELAERPDDKKLVLAGLGTADSAAALELVEKYLKDETLRSEAALAAIQIADKVRQSEPKRAAAALKNVLALVNDPAVRQKAQEVVNELEKFDDYILSWLVAGPYEERGKDARALFDLAFPAENRQSKDVKWRPVTQGIGPWGISLDAAVGGGENRAAYLRTLVLSPADQDARMEMGSDDAIKVWLNSKVVHGTNGDRGMEPRQDTVKIRLQKGANEVLVKVINHTGGWGFGLRIRKPDGTALEGLKYEAK